MLKNFYSTAKNFPTQSNKANSSHSSKQDTVKETETEKGRVKQPAHCTSNEFSVMRLGYVQVFTQNLSLERMPSKKRKKKDDTCNKFKLNVILFCTFTEKAQIPRRFAGSSLRAWIRLFTNVVFQGESKTGNDVKSSDQSKEKQLADPSTGNENWFWADCVME